MSDTQKDKAPTGFSGVSLLVPDIDSLVPSENEDLSPDTYVLARSLSPLDQDSEPDNSDQSDGTEAEATLPLVSRMGCGLLLIGGAILAFFISVSMQESSNQTFDYSRPTQTPTPPRPPQSAVKPQSAPLPRREVPTVNKPIESRKVEPPTPREPVGRPLEQKPPLVTLETLSVAQIRYCLAEEIRLDAARSVLDPYSHPDVDRFNAMIKDYNQRCSHFRYWEGDLERARKDIEPFRKEIEEEGRARFSRNRPSP